MQTIPNPNKKIERKREIETEVMWVGEREREREEQSETVYWPNELLQLNRVDVKSDKLFGFKWSATEYS